MNYAVAENWIRNFTNPLKNWRRHAKPGPFEAAWNRGIEHEIARTSWTITTAHTILGFNVSTSFRLLGPPTRIEEIQFFQKLSLIWTIYSFSFLTWLTARYEKQPVVTVKNTFFTISLAAATQSFSIFSPIFWSKTVRNVLALANVRCLRGNGKRQSAWSITEKHCTRNITEIWMMLACIFLHFWQNSEKLYFHGFQNSHCEISFFFSTKFAFNVKAIYTCKDKHVALNRLHYNSAQQQHLTSILIKEGEQSRFSGKM